MNTSRAALKWTKSATVLQRGLQTAASGAAVPKIRGPLKNARHIELSGVPTSATPLDVRRAVLQANAEGVLDVAIIYSHFMPTGKALLTLTHSGVLEKNIHALNQITISGVPIVASPTVVETTELPRQRGAKGRAEAAERGAMTGDGPNGGLSNRERSVTIWGLPGKLTVDHLASQLQRYRVDRTERGRLHIYRINPPDNQFTMVSRFLVTLDSVSEAHRLVRELHLTHWQPEVHGTKYSIRARVIY